MEMQWRLRMNSRWKWNQDWNQIKYGSEINSVNESRMDMKLRIKIKIDFICRDWRKCLMVEFCLWYLFKSPNENNLNVFSKLNYLLALPMHLTKTEICLEHEVKELAQANKERVSKTTFLTSNRTEQHCLLWKSCFVRLKEKW